ncbi:hypothetical protein Tco_0150356 [Tanacetum coccineum]
MGIAVNCRPIESGIKDFLSGVVRTMMSPDGSIMASREDINGFLAVNTSSIRVYFITLREDTQYLSLGDLIRSGYQQKDRKPSQNDKTEHGIEKTGVDNRRITLIVIRARANSAVVVSLMEFVLVVLMEMEIKSIFQLRTLLINLQLSIPEQITSLDFNSPQDLHNLQQQNLCCENCRGPHATIECQPMSQNSHSFGFDQLQTPQFSVNHRPPEALQAQEDLMKSIESFLKKFNRISFGKTPKVLLQAWDNFFEVKHAQSEEVQELLSKLVQDVKIISDELSE